MKNNQDNINETTLPTAEQLLAKFNWNKLVPISTRVYCAIVACDLALNALSEVNKIDHVAERHFRYWQDLKAEIKNYKP